MQGDFEQHRTYLEVDLGYHIVFTIDQYNQQKQQMVIEKQKRHDENQQIEEIILIYKNKIADAKIFLQEKIGDSYVQMDDPVTSEYDE
jgi:hypothetical protein